MKILQINKFFYIRGGASRYFFEVSKLLKSHGHEVAYFSMQDRKNLKSKWSKYFVTNISYEKVEFREGLYKFIRMIYSVEARKKISALLNVFRPDVVHLHSISHHLSPSIILEIKRRNIPIVQTLHDYHLISPNHTFFHDGKICEITKLNKFYKTILHKCIKNSYLATIAEVMEKYIHYWLGWERNDIDYFVAPSLFMKDKLIEFGIVKNKIIHLHHFIEYNNYQPNYKSGDSIIYFGRLSPEKGLDSLIEVIQRLPRIKFKIIGAGPMRLGIDNILEKEKNVEMIRHQQEIPLKTLISQSRFTILPSICFEILANSILESFASGKPVIASNIGGIPEIVKDGFNGFLFAPGNVDDCIKKINRLWNNPALCKKLGENARKYVEKNFGPDKHYEKLMAIYKEAINKHKI